MRHPTTSYQSVYPYNLAKCTESGHTLELDDTPGAERIRISHRDGAYVEASPGGRLVIVTQDLYGYARGGLTLTVDNNGDVLINGNLRVSVGGDAHVEVAGDASVVVNGDATLGVNGDLNAAVAGDATVHVEGDLSTSASSWSHQGDLDLTGTITVTEDVKAGDISLKNHKTSQVQSGSGTSGPPIAG